MLTNKCVVGKRVLIVALSTIMVGILFWLLMAAAYAIPSTQLTTKANQSCAILKQEGVLWMQNAALTSGAHYDNYTTYHMLNIAVQSVDNPFLDAVSSRLYQGSDPDDGLMHAIAGESNAAYQRYWHGYVTFLRPLLVFFDIKQIRLICQTTFFVLLVAVVARLTMRMRMGGGILSLILTGSLCILGAAQAAETLPFFSSFAISLVASLVAISLSQRSFNRVSSGVWSESFVLFLTFGATGALTVFFDFLDNPILSFCIPACIYFCCIRERLTLRRVIGLFAAIGLGWCFGYAALWVFKWAATALVTGEDVFGQAFNQAFILTGGIEREGIERGPLQAIAANLRPLGFMRTVLFASLIGALVCILSSVIRYFRTKDDKLKTLLLVSVALLLISFVPYLWYAVLSDHSIMHAGLMTYRDQIGALFPWLAIIALTVLLAYQKRKGAKEIDESNRSFLD